MQMTGRPLDKMKLLHEEWSVAVLGSFGHASAIQGFLPSDIHILLRIKAAVGEKVQKGRLILT